ncbi:cysteine dioxygenase family protein [Chromobacterium sp. IIBBL 290-4]|uniref:cysteine dioxygenase n=1 Tax=Chromobacterium sp. IIBBL 290-4 TaxID=2953890 RepID=UPI0020B7F6BA|nr:cysteine dioxygenase family protein [Chromobacterium sp. IIBBL 290-4]UTH74394.1 cysteine dioxygenase family protein [Chromobacterium sp. IIBBL 290-4]
MPRLHPSPLFDALRLQDELARLFETSTLPSPESIRQFLRGLRIAPEILAPFRRFGEESYRRNRIYLDEHCEMLLLCWRAGQASPAHNHRGSLCGLRVMEGVATETAFYPLSAGLALARETRELAAGSLLVNADQDIHRIANLQASGADLVTLHLYAPPLRDMAVFNQPLATSAAREQHAMPDYQI